MEVKGLNYRIIVTHENPTEEDIATMQKIEHDLDKVMKKYQLKQEPLERWTRGIETQFNYTK